MPTTESREILNGLAIRRARLRLGLTQRGLAEKCKELGLTIAPGNIHLAERQNRGIGPRKLPDLARALNTTVDELLTVELRDADTKAAA